MKEKVSESGQWRNQNESGPHALYESFQEENEAGFDKRTARLHPGNLIRTQRTLTRLENKLCEYRIDLQSIYPLLLPRLPPVVGEEC